MEATYPPSDTTSIIANLAHKPNKTTADKHRILEHHQKKTGNPLPPRGTDPSSTPPVPAPFFPNPPLANPVFPPNPLFRPRPEYPPSLPESNLSDVASELLPASHRDVDPRMARPKMVKLAGQIQNTPEMRAKFEEFRRRREKESQTAPADGEPSLAPSQRGEETVQAFRALTPHEVEETRQQLAAVYERITETATLLLKLEAESHRLASLIYVGVPVQEEEEEEEVEV